MKRLYLDYPSSVDPALRLYAGFVVPDRPCPLRVAMHGWHGQVKAAHTDNVGFDESLAGWLQVAPEMRGRGDAGGRQDCNGWELQDAVDAVEFARREFASLLLTPERATLTGGSGGGGNVMAMVGKFPDFFCRARADCGVSDYALWYRNDRVGEFRDELDPWIGTNPDANPEAYASRSGVTTAGNLLTPMIVFHGALDARVPAEQARRFVDAARRSGRGHLVAYHEFPGVGAAGGHYGGMTPEQKAFMDRAGNEFLADPPAPPEVPERGRFHVAGYLKTRRFEVVLESIDRVGVLDYDLAAGRFALSGAGPLRAALRVRTARGWDARALAAT